MDSEEGGGIKIFSSIDFGDIENVGGLSELELGVIKGAILQENVSTGNKLRDWAIVNFGVGYKGVFSLVSDISCHLVEHNGDFVLVMGEWIDPRQSFDKSNLQSYCTILTRAWVGVLDSDGDSGNGLEVQRYVSADDELFKKIQHPVYRLMIKIPYKNNSSIRVDKEENVSANALNSSDNADNIPSENIDVSRQRMVLLKPEHILNLRRQEDIYLAVNANYSGGSSGSEAHVLKPSKIPLALKIIPGREKVLPHLYELTGKSAVLDVEPDCDELYKALTN